MSKNKINLMAYNITIANSDIGYSEYKEAKNFTNFCKKLIEFNNENKDIKQRSIINNNIHNFIGSFKEDKKYLFFSLMSVNKEDLPIIDESFFEKEALLHEEVESNILNHSILKKELLFLISLNDQKCISNCDKSGIKILKQYLLEKLDFDIDFKHVLRDSDIKLEEIRNLIIEVKDNKDNKNGSSDRLKSLLKGIFNLLDIDIDNAEKFEGIKILFDVNKNKSAEYINNAIIELLYSLKDWKATTTGGIVINLEDRISIKTIDGYKKTKSESLIESVDNSYEGYIKANMINYLKDINENK